VSEFMVFAVIGIGTYLLRASFIMIVGDRMLSEWAERLLANVGPAVLAALITSLLLTDGAAAFLTDPAKVMAVLVAVPVAWKTRNFGWTFVAGMSVFWIVGAMRG
jgi:branched-subunit amino acid transport protein